MKLKSIIIFIILSVSVPGFADSSLYPQEVDQIVAAELKRLDQQPRPKVDDYTFCRRIYLDSIGRIPTIDELNLFIADKRVGKRARLIDKFQKS